MANISELEALKELEKILSKLDDPLALKRVLDWAYSKFSPSSKKDPLPPDDHTPREKKLRGKKAIKSKHPKRTSCSIIKELNLSPKRKKSFKAFFIEKKPKDGQELAALAVYYLKRTLELPRVSVNHIYTCFKDVGHRVFANMEQSLMVTAHRKGWVDTSELDNIKLTPIGENYVEHDLPRKIKGAEK